MSRLPLRIACTNSCAHHTYDEWWRGEKIKLGENTQIYDYMTRGMTKDDDASLDGSSAHGV